MNRWTYNISAAKFKRGDLFVTNTELRKRIEGDLGKKLKEGDWVGYVKVEVNHYTGVITTKSFYPFFSEEHEDRFSRIGIATFIENQIEKDLMKKFPGYRITTTGGASPPRQKRLRERGRWPNVTEPIEIAYEKSRRMVVAGIRKRRPKKEAAAEVKRPVRRVA